MINDISYEKIILDLRVFVRKLYEFQSNDLSTTLILIWYPVW